MGGSRSFRGHLQADIGLSLMCRRVTGLKADCPLIGVAGTSEKSAQITGFHLLGPWPARRFPSMGAQAAAAALPLLRVLGANLWLSHKAPTSLVLLGKTLEGDE